MLKLKALLKNILIWLNDALTLKVFDYSKFTYNSGFTYYATSGEYTPIATKRGRIVTLSGAFKNTAKQSTGEITMGYVPDSCKPLQTQCFLQNTSNINRYVIAIYLNGRITIQRYGTSSAIEIPANTQININHTYISAN